MPKQITVDGLQEQVEALVQAASLIQATADEEANGQLSEPQAKEIKDTFAKIDNLKASIETRKKLEVEQAALTVPAPRRSAPEAVAEATGGYGSRVTGGAPAGAKPGLFNFRTQGEFYRAVVAGGRRGATPDQRLLIGNAAPGSYGAEGAAEDGGFAVAPEIRTQIVKLVMGEDSLLGRTDLQTISGNSLQVPVDETTPQQASGGILATWDGEATQGTPTKLALGKRQIDVHKLKALVPVTEELLSDATAIESYIQSKVPDKFGYKINQALLWGTGVGMPLGIVKAPAAVSVAKEAGPQTADTVVYANVRKMWGRLAAQYRNDAIWLINQDVEEQLGQMVISSTAGGIYPVYLPPGGIAGNQYATLYGKPVIPVEACSEIGTQGDIILWSPKGYLSASKGGMRFDVSMHCWFEYDIQAFRFIMRIGGAPWLSAAITRAHGSNTLSSIVLLDDR